MRSYKFKSIKEKLLAAKVTYFFVNAFLILHSMRVLGCSGRTEEAQTNGRGASQD